MKSPNTSLLNSVVAELNKWQTTAKAAGCLVEQINLRLPDNTTAVFYYLETENVWDIDTQTVNASPGRAAAANDALPDR